MTVFWVVVLCSLEEVHQDPDDGGSKHILNLSKLLPNYIVQQPRRQPSAFVIRFLFTNVVAEWLVLLLHIGEVQGSNLN
jgi:hypothetical protein